jgi:hypothetical protein
MTEELYNKCYALFADRFLCIIGILRASLDNGIIRMCDDNNCMIIDKNSF